MALDLRLKLSSRVTVKFIKYGEYAPKEMVVSI